MAALTQTAGQAAARFFEALRGGRFPHACFVACADTLFAESLCRRAAALWCTGEADAARLKSLVNYAELGEEPIRVDQIRELVGELQKRPFEEGGRCVYIRNAHTMSEPVQNALLKTLEEPPGGTLFLFTGNESGLLPTIRSRCGRFLYPAPMQGEIAAFLRDAGASAAEAAQYAAWGGTTGRALRLYQSEAFRTLRQGAQRILQAFLLGKLPFEDTAVIAKEGEEAALFMLSLLRDILLCKEGMEACGNPEQQAEIAKLARRFTRGQITCIINILADGLERLATNASAQATFSSLLTQIAEEIS
ncbi:MAG: hypothetical protein VB049_00960 [Candidatus Pelethousia sp.]|nr:hypothetical protein [Candidatus Pelethousia sp.]